MKTWRGCLIRSLACAFLPLLLASCTPGVKGVYTCEGGLLDSISLESGGKAYASATMFGMKQQRAGTYTVDGDKVVITINGDSTVFTHSGKTLDGGVIAGKCTAR